MKVKTAETLYRAIDSAVDTVLDAVVHVDLSGDLYDDEVQQLVYMMREMRDARRKLSEGLNIEPITDDDIDDSMTYLIDAYHEKMEKMKRD